MNDRIWLAALMLFALAQGLAYAFIVPIWQAPDEPMLYEYAALVAELGRIPQTEDHSAALEQRMADSLARQHFWRYRGARNPAAPPRTMEGVLARFWMPRQVGGDPPLYFALAAAPLRLAAGWPPERQALMLRQLNALLLPCIVACAYGAARELCLRPTADRRKIEDRGSRIEDRSPRHPVTPSPCRVPLAAAALVAFHRKIEDRGSRIEDRSPRHPVTLSPCRVPLAAAALVAFHPMFAVIGASLSNDGLANLFGAGLCWMMLRLLRCGVTLRRAALAAGLLCLGLLTKRTMLPYLPLLLVLGLGWVLARRPWYGRSVEPAGGPKGRRSAFSLLHSSSGRWLIAAAALVFAVVWMYRQFDYQSAATWKRYGSWEASARVWPADQPDMPAHGAAQRLAAGEMNFQPLPAVGADLLRGRSFRFGARIWSPVPARGRLIVETGDGWHEWPFEVHGELSPEAAGDIAKDAYGVWFGIAADSGWFYADDFWATGQDMPNDLLINGGSELPALAADSPLWETLRYLRLPDVVWTLQSGHISDPLPRGGDWVSVFFASFWGQFGWMDVSFVFGTLWMPILTLMCLAGLLGALFWLLWRRGQAWQRRQVWALLLLLVFAISLPVINAYSVPLHGAFQQGRYLFPALVPLAIVIALGQSAVVPPRWRRGWLWLWLGFWLALALAALFRLVVYYHL